jgi:hypothetical protein
MADWEQLTHLLQTIGDLFPARVYRDQETRAPWETARTARHRDAALWQGAPMALLVTDQWGNIHEVNQAATVLFNMPPVWLMRRPLVVFVPLQERYAFRVFLSHLVGGEDLPAWEGHLQPWRRSPLPVALAARVLSPPHILHPSLVWRVCAITC